MILASAEDRIFGLFFPGSSHLISRSLRSDFIIFAEAWRRWGTVWNDSNSLSYRLMPPSCTMTLPSSSLTKRLTTLKYMFEWNLMVKIWVELNDEHLREIKWWLYEGHQMVTVLVESNSVHIIWGELNGECLSRIKWWTWGESNNEHLKGILQWMLEGNLMKSNGDCLRGI